MKDSVNRFCRLAVLLLMPAFGFAASEDVVVTQVITSKSLVLEDGRVVRLAAIQAPNIAHPEKGAGDPMGEDARRALAQLVEGKRVILKPVKGSPDRRGRVVAFVVDDAGREVQAELLKAGMAMVYTFPDTAARAEELLAIEREARLAKRGIWAEPYFSVVEQGEAMTRRDRFALVEGVVRNVEERKSATYLNFGDNWKTDFTLTVDRGDRTRRFKQFDLKALEGKRIRVRGWIYSKNGPMIDLTHPEQIELLTASGPPVSPLP